MLTRALIVLLVVLNLGVAAWWAFAPTPTVQAPRPTELAPRLQLLGEARVARRVPVLAPPPQSAIDTHPDASQTPAITATRCYTLGPFADAATAASAGKILEARVTELHVRTSTAGRHGWRVWLPPLADHESAVAMAARIDAAGFKDYYIVPTGDEQNSIALGRFGNQSAAERQQAALATAGFPAQAEALGTATQWIDIIGRGDFDVTAARRQTGAAQARPVACAPR